jgi:hypothetical protein
MPYFGLKRIWKNEKQKSFFSGHSVPSRLCIKYPSVISGHFWSCSVMPGNVRSCLVMPGHARSCTVMSGHVRSCLVMSGYVRSCPVMSGHVRSCPVMSGHVRSCPVMSGHVRSFTVMYGHVQSCPVMSKNSFANSNSVVRDRKSSTVHSLYPIGMLQNECYLVDRLFMLSLSRVGDRAADFKCKGPEFESRQKTYHLSNYCS